MGSKFDLVVPFPPGGVDLLARILVDELQRQLASPVEIVYRPGEGGAVGAASVAHTSPDGQTLLFAPIGPVLLQPAYRNTPYGWQSFAPVCRLTSTPVAILASERCPHRDFGELLAEARRQPGRFGYVHAGAGGIPHIAMAWICKRQGIDMRCVAREGAANALKAIVAGEADVFAEQAPLAAARLPEGRLRAIAILAADRHPAFPEAPTSAECGVALTLSSWNVVMAPGGTPAPVVRRIADAFRASLADARVAAAMKEQLRVEASFLDPSPTAAFIAAEAAHLQPLLAELWGTQANPVPASVAAKLNP